MEFAHLENRAKTLRPSAVKVDPKSVYPMSQKRRCSWSTAAVNLLWFPPQPPNLSFQSALRAAWLHISTFFLLPAAHWTLLSCEPHAGEWHFAPKIHLPPPLVERHRASSWFQQERGREKIKPQTKKHPAPGCSKIMNFAANMRDSVESWKNARLHDHRNAESMGPRERWLGQFTSLCLCFELLAVLLRHQITLSSHFQGYLH